MTPQKIKDRTRAFVLDNFIVSAAARGFRDSDSFTDLHVIDSTGFLELITHLEEAYGITVEDEEILPENLDSLDAITAYVGRKLGPGAST